MKVQNFSLDFFQIYSLMSLAELEFIPQSLTYHCHRKKGGLLSAPFMASGNTDWWSGREIIWFICNGNKCLIEKGMSHWLNVSLVKGTNWYQNYETEEGEEGGGICRKRLEHWKPFGWKRSFSSIEENEQAGGEMDRKITFVNEESN